MNATLDFVLKVSGYLAGFENGASRCVYQITDDGRYCIGWAHGDIREGWQEYPFEFNSSIITQIIKMHLDKQEVKRGDWDGFYEKGFLIKAIPESLAEEASGIRNPFYGIVEFSPYTCFYTK